MIDCEFDTLILSLVLIWIFYVFSFNLQLSKKIFFYTFALFSLTSIIYGMAYDYMNGAEIHYDFFGAGFVSWLIFFGILKAILNI